MNARQGRPVTKAQGGTGEIHQGYWQDVKYVIDHILKPKEIIILGMAPSSQECPFDGEVWSVNNGFTQIAEMRGHVNKIFLAHKQVYKEGRGVFDWETFNNLQRLGVDIINTHKVPGLKARLFPIKRISEKLGCAYFSNSICYMLAYAIDQYTVRTKKPPYVRLKEPLKLRFYGIDMRETGEYAFEKGGVEYWMGFARGLGIEIENTEFSTLCKTVTYEPYGFKELDVTKLVDGGRIIIGLDGRVYGKGNYPVIGTSDNGTK